MKFNFERRGLIFDPVGRSKWMQHYAQVPVPIQISPDRLKIFFTCRPQPDEDGNFISHIASVDVNPHQLDEILHVSPEPVLSLGGIGDFDEHGIHPVGAIHRNDEIWLYFQGWERGYSIPYRTSLGLAISQDNGKSFKKIGKGPIMSRTVSEPYLENGHFVFEGENGLQMVYATCNEWVLTNGKKEPVYFLTQAFSEDGINWQRNGNQIIDSRYEIEASGRPTVMKLNSAYHLWFCYRDVMNFRGNSSGGYKIGYAWSEDGVTWTRNDALSGIVQPDEGWDSQMQAYPYIFKAENRLILFYNGNEFGKYGIGYAEMILDRNDC